MSNQPKIQYGSLSQFHANHVLRSDAAITDAINSHQYMQGKGTSGILHSLTRMEFPDLLKQNWTLVPRQLENLFPQPLRVSEFRDEGPFKGLVCHKHDALHLLLAEKFLLSRSGVLNTLKPMTTIVSGLLPQYCASTGEGVEVVNRAFSAATVQPVLSKASPRLLNSALTLATAFRFATRTNCTGLLGNPQHVAYVEAAFGAMHPALTVLLEHCEDVPDAIVLALASDTHYHGAGQVFAHDETVDRGNTYCQSLYTEPMNRMTTQLTGVGGLVEVPDALHNAWAGSDVLDTPAQHMLLDAAIARYTDIVNPNGVSRAVRELLRLYIQNVCAIDAAAARTAKFAPSNNNTWRCQHHGAGWFSRHNSMTAVVKNLAVMVAGLNILSKGVPVGLHVNRSVAGVPEVQYALMSLQAIPDSSCLSIRTRLSSCSVDAYWVGLDARSISSSMRNSVVGDQLVSVPAHPKYDRVWHWAYEAGPSSCMTGYCYDTSPVRAYCAEGSGLYLHIRFKLADPVTADDLLAVVTDDDDAERGMYKEVLTGRAIGAEKSYVRAYGQLMDSFLKRKGFEHDSTCLEGQPLRFINHPEENGYILMPYLDGDSYNVTIDGDEITVDDSGAWDAQDSTGRIYFGNTCRCAKCGDSVPEDDTHSTDTDGGSLRRLF